MSPHSVRNPSPASGDVADARGRHRRPESLADGPVFRATTLLEQRTVPGPRSARHHQPTAAGPRHRAVNATPPVTGSHRAPGTLPIESWLLMGKKRQQLLLASLIAVGLVLVALPGTPAREGVHAVNAAAQRAIGVNQPPARAKAEPKHEAGSEGKAQTAREKPAPKASTPAGKPAPTAPREVKNTGPGNSLRTTGTTAVALTFDDGPDPVQTPKILALLRKYQIKATFCLVGRQVEKNPEIVREIVADGHTLCNHTWNHSLTIGKDKPEDIAADLDRTNAAIHAAVPDAKIPFFRAPGGNFSDRLVDVAGQAGMTSLYWQVDPSDWDHLPGETDAAHTTRVIASIKKHVRPGSIILSHDFNQPDTIAAYEKLLPWLAGGFTLGIPGEPVPATPTTPPAAEPAPTSAEPASPTTTAPAPTPTEKAQG